MRSLLGLAWFWVGASALCACTLTAEDFDPVRFDSPADPRGDTSGDRGAAALPALEGCDSDCAASSSNDSSGSPEPGAVGPNGSPSDETGTTELPLAGDGDGSNDGAPNDGASDPPAPPPVVAPPPVPNVPVETEPPVVEPPLNETLLGWASVAGLGIATTTGGAAGATVRATTAQELETFAALPEPLVIELSGTIRLGRVLVASNKTLRGVGTAPRLEGGLRIRGEADAFVQNVIVQNLAIDAAFSEVEGDGVQIHYAHHVWVDHCEVSNAGDGNLDVVHGSDFVTVSWNRFSYASTSAGERNTTLIGHSSAGAAEDSGHLRVTLHHNAWLDGILGATPSVRFGDVHVFNNYYASPAIGAAISAAVGSRLLVENNFFDNVARPYQIDASGIAPGGNLQPQLRAQGNVFTATGLRLEQTGAAFVPPYVYVKEAAASVPELVLAGAGATLSIAGAATSTP